MRFFIVGVVAFCACGGVFESEVFESVLSARGVLQPQSFIHDAVDDRRPKVAWSFTGAAGDVVAPDVWPAPSTSKQNALHPVLTLLGPPRNGKRPVLATGSPRNQDDRHQAIDGFRLARGGNHLVVVAQAG